MLAVQIMGVLNVTPDSFSDGGCFAAPEVALAHALRMIEEGAEIIDVGGESTRPGARPVAAAEQIARVVPVIQALRQHFDGMISIDTCRPEVMRAAVAAGANMINDVWALQLPGALETAASLGVRVCLMHMQGEPATMQQEPAYRDVVSEVCRFLEQRTSECLRAGMRHEQLVVDPGFGFGKRLEHNLALLRGLPRLARLGFPVLIGVSRKSMIGQITGRPVAERLHGSLAMAVYAVLNGASILRVHDVGPTRDAMRVVTSLVESERDG